MSSAPYIGTSHTSIIPVGSRVTCNPPPEDTDRDFLVLVPRDKYAAFCDALLLDGWEVGGSLIPIDHDERGEEAHFNSFTRDGDNIIATASAVFHRRFLAASAVARKLNLMDKRQRIMLFQAVLYAAIADPFFEPNGYEVFPLPVEALA